MDLSTLPGTSSPPCVAPELVSRPARVPRLLLLLVAAVHRQQRPLRGLARDGAREALPAAAEGLLLGCHPVGHLHAEVPVAEVVLRGKTGGGLGSNGCGSLWGCEE